MKALMHSPVRLCPLTCFDLQFFCICSQAKAAEDKLAFPVYSGGE